MDYLLKASGIIVILFSFYHIFLKNETFFKSIRHYFLTGLIVVVSIPLLEIPIYAEQVATQFNLSDYQDITTSQMISQPVIDWGELLLLIYILGVIFFSCKFLIQIISLGFLLSKHELVKMGNYYFVETTKDVSPFSFFNIIIYNKSQFSLDELEQIINHEKAHALQFHSIDTLLSHLLVITLWFNPFVWWYKNAVRQNLEFLADAYALEKAENQKFYQLTLLKTCGATYCTQLTNNFYNSLIKKRILMLHKNKSESKNQWKYALLIPMLLAFVLIFNTKVIAQEKKQVEIKKVIQKSIIDILIDKNTSDERLNEQKETFKNDFDVDVAFSGIKRNSEGEITHIKISAKRKDSKTKFESSGINAIKPIKISYNSDNQVISISNVDKLHKNHIAFTIDKEDGKHIVKKHKKGWNTVFVTSDGKNKIWKHKKGDSINTELIEIHEEGEKDGDKELVWIHRSHKDKDNNVKIEVIESKDGKSKIKVIEDIHVDIDQHEDVDIIINEDGKKVKISNGGNYAFFHSDGEKPLIIMDGKETTMEELEKMKPDSFKSIDVLKGKKAIAKYGDKAKDGVIIITTRK